MAKRAKKQPEIKLPPVHDWRTTDTDEINKRWLRAREESFVIRNTTPQHPVFSNFAVKSGKSAQTYSVELRDLANRHFGCDCVDFRINNLGTCKHAEAVLLHLESRFKGLFNAARKSGSNRVDVVVDPVGDTLRLSNGHVKMPRAVGKWFGPEGRLAEGSPESALEVLREFGKAQFPQLRLSQEIEPRLENRRRAAERKQLRHEYEMKVQSGEWPAQETTVPLFPYQREGMLHLAFTERALLADEMGLGKTIQAIAACALLHRLGKAKRVLVVTPASLKTEWEEQIRRFTTLDYKVVFGGKFQRLKEYADPRFFTIVNYEQVVSDALDVNDTLKPDVVVLDEAQRIKNWSTKTAQTVKRLRSRYAFVLTGTPIENRIDELHSLMDFLEPSVLGPLFRFNRDFYDLDDRGRPAGFRNLDVLHQRIKPYMLRRRKSEVETELPERTDRNHFVTLTEGQKSNYGFHEQQVQRLVATALRRPLTKQEQDKLQRELAMMRMTCDTNYILDQEDRACPKLAEIEKLLEECAENEAKVIIFSEWERMLELVREHCQQNEIGFAWHTGSVPQQRRRSEINAFKDDPKCRVFLSTDAGATGLNLQNANVVINCDLPWNPAKLEQRIARAWRKHQTRPVTVINLISENTIEHRMLQTLAMKQSVAASVLDKPGEVKEIKLRSRRQAMAERISQSVSASSISSKPATEPKADAKANVNAAGVKALPVDRSLAFAQLAAERINGAMVRCEERYPIQGAHTVLMVVVERDSAQWREHLKGIYSEMFRNGQTDPLAPVQLEVLDRATDEAIQRMIGMGLIAKTTRATRPLFPLGDEMAPAGLTTQEQEEIRKHQEHAGRKLKMASVLAGSGFCEEARPALLEAIHAFGRASAVQSRMPLPPEVKDVALAPLSNCWGEQAASVRSFIADPAADWSTAAQVLGARLAANS